MVLWATLLSSLLILQSCLIPAACLEASHNLGRNERIWVTRTLRSQPEQHRNSFPVTRTPGEEWTTSSNNENKRGLDVKLLASRAYQMASNQPLYYSKQNYRQSNLYDRSWRKNPIGSVPVGSFYKPRPALTQNYNFLQNTAGSRNVLPPGANLWSNVDEDVKFVEEKIQEYYDQRLDKDKNRWMFKPVEGTTKHLKEIFIGRCWDFLENRAKYLENPTKLDCQELWKAFLKSFAFKEPCDVKLDDYTSFFKMYDEKPLNDRVLFWSGTRELTHAYSGLYNRFTTLEDTLAGFLLNGLRWCGSKKEPGIDFKSCPYQCSKQKAFWGQAAAKLAKRARGVVHVMLNGTRQHFVDRQIFPSFMDDSYLAENQISSLLVKEIREFRILVGHSLHHKALERCDSLSVLELENRARGRGLKTTCFDNPYFIRHLLCLDNPGDPLCLFKIDDQEKLL